MRVTEFRMVELATQSVGQSREKIEEAIEEVASGIRVARPSVDGAAWAEGVRAAARSAMSGRRGNAMGRARSGLDEADRTFDTIGGVLIRVRELTVQMANGTMDARARTAAGLEVQQLRAASIAAANVRGPDGEYIFSGSQGATQPFDPTTGAYAGDSVVRSIETAEGQRQQVTVAGDVLTATYGVNVFAELENLRTALNANNQTAVRDMLPALDTAITQINRARTEIGAKINALDVAELARQGFEINLAEQHAKAVESDAFAAASKLAKTKVALESSRIAAEEIIALARPR